MTKELESLFQHVDKGGAMSVQAGPVQPRDPHAKTKALAALRQATWEATQFLTYDETREYVDGVLREVESDEP